MLKYLASLQMAPSGLARQTTSWRSQHGRLMKFAIDLVKFCVAVCGAQNDLN